MKVNIMRIIAGLMATQALLTALPAAAGEAPAVSLTEQPMADNRLKDGETLARGRIVYRAAHAGMRVWLETPHSGEAPDRYVLTGKRSGSQLRVRLVLDGSVPDRHHGTGVVLAGQDELVNPEIVADGQQRVTPDEYEITLRATVPEAE